jgi:hypothetical protein
MAFRLRLHHRIVIPFAVVAVAAILASAFLALTVVSHEFESRTRAQLINTADVITRGGFAVNPAILRSVKMITGADVITFDATGTVISSTVEPSQTALIAAVTGQAAQDARAAGPGGLVRDMSCGHPCIVAYRPVVGRVGMFVAVVIETEATAAANRAVSRTILLAAVASLAVLVLVSQVVARRVTAPIDALVRYSQAVGAGTNARAAVPATMKSAVSAARSIRCSTSSTNRRSPTSVTRSSRSQACLRRGSRTTSATRWRQ